MTDLVSLRGGQSIRSVLAVEIALSDSGPVLYLSERNLTIGSQAYEDYLIGIKGMTGELYSVGEGPIISLSNERYMTYGSLSEIGQVYPFEGALCVIKEAYLDPLGSSDIALTSALLARFVIVGARRIDLMKFELSGIPVGRKFD